MGHAARPHSSGRAGARPPSCPALRQTPTLPPPRPRQVSYLRAWWEEEAIRRALPTGRMFAVNCALLASALCHLGLIFGVPRLYARKRTAVQIAMRAIRLASHLQLCVFSGVGLAWWAARLAKPAADPGRVLTVMLAGAGWANFVTSMINPVPAALQLLFAAASLPTWTHGWLGTYRAMWERPELAGAAGASCESLQLAATAANNAALAVFG
jgi:hypothetical protein